MAKLRVDLYGSPALIVGGEARRHSARKVMALFAYLAMRAGEAQTRTHLSELLWPDSAEEQARTNLRQALSKLRKFLDQAAPDLLVSEGDLVQLRAETLEIPLPSPDNGSSARSAAFLEGFSARSTVFDEWAARERRRIEATLSPALEASAGKKTATGDLSGAAADLAQALAVDPLNEALHRAQMRALDSLGKSAEALKQFERCRELLARELQAEPAGETRQLAAEIRAGRMTGSTNDKHNDGQLYYRHYPKARAVELHRINGGAGAVPTNFPSSDAAVKVALEDRLDSSDTTFFVVIPAIEENAGRQRAAAIAAAGSKAGVYLDAAVFEDFESVSDYELTAISDASGTIVGYHVGGLIETNRSSIVATTDHPERSAALQQALIVLPFMDYSPDADQVALGDAIADELNARLARFRTLTLASNTAAQTCRALNLTGPEIRAKLGVRYAVDGSVMRLGKHLRINLSLIDLTDDHVIFSDQFEGEFVDIFDRQNVTIGRITNSVVNHAEKAEIDRVNRAFTNDVGAYDWFIKGLAAYRRAGIQPHHARDAFNCFTNASELDPNFGRATAWRLCSVSWYDHDYFNSVAEEEIGRAVVADPYDSEVRRIAGGTAIYMGDYATGIAQIEKSVELNPSDAYLLTQSATYWGYYGEPENGVKYLKRAMQLDPFLPHWCLEENAVNRYLLDDYDGAITQVRALPVQTARALTYQVAAEVANDDLSAARTTVEKLNRRYPDHDVHLHMFIDWFRDGDHKEGLRKRLQQVGLAS
jgi:DNA-binding SARP family transcriptional activator/TolB-like protein